MFRLWFLFEFMLTAFPLAMWFHSVTYRTLARADVIPPGWAPGFGGVPEFTHSDRKQVLAKQGSPGSKRTADIA